MELFSSWDMEMGPEVIAFRLFCALVMGAIVGMERELTHRPAGLRTHMLVALGACAVMLIGQLVFEQYTPLGAMPDPARMAAQVVAGVGFLGAGTIMREGNAVRGLTTAASIWTVACLGLAVGAGYYYVGLFGTGFVLVTLICFEWLQKLLMKNRYCSFHYTVRCRDIFEGLNKINELAKKHRAELLHLQTKKMEGTACEITFQVEYKGRRSDQRAEAFCAELVALESVTETAVQGAAT